MAHSLVGNFHALLRGLLVVRRHQVQNLHHLVYLVLEHREVLLERRRRHFLEAFAKRQEN